MPITNTLEVSRRLTQAGVPTHQAEVLSELFESTAQDAVREMKAIVTQDGERTRSELRAEFQRDLRAQLIWYIASQIALIGAAAAILKTTMG